MDSNKLRSHTKIGEGSVKLPSTLMNLTASCVLSVSIQDSKHKAVGVVEVTLVSLPQHTTPTVNNPVKTVVSVSSTGPIGDNNQVTKSGPIGDSNQVTKTSDPATPPTIKFLNGTISIKKIKLENIKNVEYFGKNDLFCRIQLGSNTFTTPTMPDAGTAAFFEYLDMKVSVNNEIFTEIITLQVYDANSVTSNVLIGQCVLPLAMLKQEDIGTPTHSLTHSLLLTHSLTHILTHSHTHSLTHSLTRY